MLIRSLLDMQCLSDDHYFLDDVERKPDEGLSEMKNDNVDNALQLDKSRADHYSQPRSCS